MKVYKEHLLCSLCLCLFLSCCTILQAKEIDTSISKRISKQRFIFDTLPANLEEITVRADRIFSGVCTSAEEINNDPDSKLSVVKYTFKVADKIKGVKKDEISFKQWKPTVQDVGYEVGKKYILFLYPNSKLGLTSPVGFLQGYFSVYKDKKTKEETVINRLGNIGLSRNLRTQKIISINADKKLNDYINQSSENGQLIKYKEFIRTIKYLAEQQ